MPSNNNNCDNKVKSVGAKIGDSVDYAGEMILEGAKSAHDAVFPPSSVGYKVIDGIDSTGAIQNDAKPTHDTTHDEPEEKTLGTTITESFQNAYESVFPPKEPTLGSEVGEIIDAATAKFREGVINVNDAASPPEPEDKPLGTQITESFQNAYEAVFPPKEPTVGEKIGEVIDKAGEKIEKEFKNFEDSLPPIPEEKKSMDIKNDEGVKKTGDKTM